MCSGAALGRRWGCLVGVGLVPGEHIDEPFVEHLTVRKYGIDERHRHDEGGHANHDHYNDEYWADRSSCEDLVQRDAEK